MRSTSSVLSVFREEIICKKKGTASRHISVCESETAPQRSVHRLLKELIDGLEREVQSLADSLVREMTVNGVETILQTGHLLEGSLVALRCDVNRIGDRRVGDTKRRGAGDSARDVCNGVVDNAVLLERRVLMRRAVVARLDRASASARRYVRRPCRHRVLLELQHRKVGQGS